MPMADPDRRGDSYGAAKRARTSREERRRGKLKEVRRQMKARAIDRARRLRPR
jgi:hypothetical protein